MSKEAADLCREAASVIEAYGHHKGDFGTTASGFCMYGALGMAQGKKVETRHIAGVPITSALPVHADPRIARIKELTRARFGSSPSAGYPGADDFNDLPATTGKDVQKFLLQLADELEVQ